MHVTKNMTESCHIGMLSQQKMQQTTSQNMTTRSQNTISHIPRHMLRNTPPQQNDSCQSYNTSAKNMTTQSHMPRRTGIFSARAGPRRAQTPRPVKACHTCCWDRRFCPFIRPHTRIYSYDWCPKRLVGNYWTQSPRASSPPRPSWVIFCDFMTEWSNKWQS